MLRRENEQSRVHIYQGTYFESSQIHQPAIFEHINHDIYINFLFQNLYRLFLRA